MALDAVVADILATSKGRLAELDAEAEKEVAGILGEARDRAADIKSRKDAEAEHAMEALKRREISSAHLEVKRVELNLHKEFLEQAQVKLMEAIQNMPAKDNEAMLKKLIEPYDLEDMKVFSNKEDEAFVSSLAPNYGGAIDCIGGVVIESGDGFMRYDLTYDTVAREVFNNSVKEASKMLFG